MQFNEILKGLRKAKNISQGVLAEKLNISLKTVSHWETGYTEPSITQLIEIADYFEVSLDELLGREFKN